MGDWMGWKNGFLLEWRKLIANKLYDFDVFQLKFLEPVSAVCSFFVERKVILSMYF